MLTRSIHARIQRTPRNGISRQVIFAKVASARAGTGAYDLLSGSPCMAALPRPREEQYTCRSAPAIPAALRRLMSLHWRNTHAEFWTVTSGSSTIQADVVIGGL